MAKRELVGLFSAIAGRDWTAAEKTARALIDVEERAGHHLTASRLRTALTLNGHAAPSSSSTNGTVVLHTPAQEDRKSVV